MVVSYPQYIDMVVSNPQYVDMVVSNAQYIDISPGARRVLFMFCLPKGCLVS